MAHKYARSEDNVSDIHRSGKAVDNRQGSSVYCGQPRASHDIQVVHELAPVQKVALEGVQKFALEWCKRMHYLRQTILIESATCTGLKI